MMKVKEGVTYRVGSFKCPICGENHYIICRPKKDNPEYKTNRHYIE